MRLYIIRHGETLWNTEGRLQGRVDIELNENGIRLGKITGEGLKDVPFDLAFTSPLKRAKKTAELALEGKDIPIIVDDRLTEICFGVWEGLKCRKEDCEIPSDVFPKFFEDPFQYTAPEGGEEIAQVIARSREFYEDLLANKEYQDKTILVAGHGCSTRALLYAILGHTDDFWRGMVPPNCAVTIIDVEDGKSRLVELDKIYYNKSDVVDYYKPEK